MAEHRPYTTNYDASYLTELHITSSLSFAVRVVLRTPGYQDKSTRRRGCRIRNNEPNKLIYTTATVMLAMLGYGFTRGQKQLYPPWRRRLEAKIKVTWGEVN